MPFSLDPEVQSGVNALFEELDLGDIGPMAVGDVASRRAIFDPMQRRMFQNIAAFYDVTIEVLMSRPRTARRSASAGTARRARLFRRPSSTRTAAA